MALPCKRITFLLGLFLVTCPGRASPSEPPQIASHSKSLITAYQGEKIQLNVKAIGESLSYSWSLVTATGGSPQYKNLCKTASCVVDTAAYKLGTYRVDLAVGNPSGAAFVTMTFQLVERPSKILSSDVVQVDMVPANPETTYHVKARRLVTRLHQASYFYEGVVAYAQEDDIAASTQFVYARWHEPKNRMDARYFLGKIDQRKRLYFAAQGGLHYDSNFLGLGSQEELPEHTPVSQKSRTTYHTNLALRAKLVNAPYYDASLGIADDRYIQVDVLKSLGFDSPVDPGMHEANISEQTLSLPVTFYDHSAHERSAFKTTLAPRLGLYSIGGVGVEQRFGLHVVTASPSLGMEPHLSLLVEQRSDAMTGNISLLHPTLREVASSADLSGLFTRLELGLNPINEPSRSCHLLWSFDRLSHAQTQAQDYDFNALTFLTRHRLSLGLRQQLGVDLGIQERLFPMSKYGRHDRLILASVLWNWFYKPFFYRIIQLEFENLTSNQQEKSRTRLVFSLGGILNL